MGRVSASWRYPKTRGSVWGIATLLRSRCCTDRRVPIRITHHRPTQSPGVALTQCMQPVTVFRDMCRVYEYQKHCMVAYHISMYITELFVVTCTWSVYRYTVLPGSRTIPCVLPSYQESINCLWTLDHTHVTDKNCRV